VWWLAAALLACSAIAATAQPASIRCSGFKGSSALYFDGPHVAPALRGRDAFANDALPGTALLLDGLDTERPTVRILAGQATSGAVTPVDLTRIDGAAVPSFLFTGPDGSVNMLSYASHLALLAWTIHGDRTLLLQGGVVVKALLGRCERVG